MMQFVVKKIMISKKNHITLKSTIIKVTFSPSFYNTNIIISIGINMKTKRVKKEVNKRFTMDISKKKKS